MQEYCSQIAVSRAIVGASGTIEEVVEGSRAPEGHSRSSDVGERGDSPRLGIGADQFLPLPRRAQAAALSSRLALAPCSFWQD